ncbi:MAG: HAMP domain-containing sensor histidine kinase [Pseudomonadota bacterium]
MSLTSRVALIGALGAIAFMLLVFIAVRSASSAIVNENVDTYLAAYADVLVPAIRIENDGIVIATENPVLQAMPRDWQVSLNGEPQVKSTQLVDWIPSSRTLGSTFEVSDAGRTLLVHRRAYQFPNKQQVEVAFALEKSVVDAFALGQRQRVSARMRPVLVLAAVIVTVLLFLQVYAVSRPLRATTRALDNLAAGTTGSLPGHWPRELDAMAQRINALNERNSETLRRYRQFAANLSHALKTPLTVLRQKSLDKEMTENVALMDRLVERHLKRAQIAGPQSVAGAKIDLKALLKRLVSAYSKLGSQRIDLVMPDALLVVADADDMTEVFGNLVENAQRFAQHQIRISLSGGSVCVDDDGPGLDPDQMAVVVERGARLDSADKGSGIGLAVSREIVELYGGSLSLSRSDLGGLRVACELPGLP